MNYYSLLNQIIDESKLSLKEISKKCEENGVSVTPSYISKLKSGKQQPASEEVNKAIANACGYNDKIEELLFESYKEKSPKFFKDFLSELDILFRETTKKFIGLGFNGDLKEKMEAQTEKLSDYEIIVTSLKTLKALNNSGMLVPKKNNDIKESTISDDSMSPLIPKGAKFLYRITEDVCNGDYIVALIGDEYLIRRFVSYEGKATLLPENKKYEVVEGLLGKDIVIVGKLINVTFELN